MELFTRDKILHNTSIINSQILGAHNFARILRQFESNGNHRWVLLVDLAMYIVLSFIIR